MNLDWKHSGCFMHEKHHNATVPDLLDGGVTTRASLQDGTYFDPVKELKVGK
jgi:hypothetical protein